MDIKQLKFLIALDETRHFSHCHITQPTLSMRLRSLEEELDLQLVNRGQRFEGFTAPGERVLAWARTVLAAYDGLQAEAAACRGNLVGTLRLQPIAEARTLARLGLIMRRGAPRSALAEACFALHQRSSNKA
ncbi:LysR family transcriptional regulator [Pseudomonas gingeri]|uniref:LysR family transcriptional regulator n=1 Tax=Pseudomonas gingeri TaxID=117681 RepID=A0A7Y7WWZ0_9PSED|nr:LysR family transcriptional regulator [Pseudomonas gingeri]